MRYDEIMAKAIRNMVAKQNKITDFNEGSVIHTILDTVARIAEREYVAIRQGYNEMLSCIPYSAFGFTKKQGQKAVGTVVFYTDSVKDNTIQIPKGTVVEGGGLLFETTEEGSIQAGQLHSQEVQTIAQETGAIYNVSIGTISNVESNVPFVCSVKNTKPFTQACDTEQDADFEARFKAYIAGLSGTTSYAIKATALSVEGVRSVATVEHKPLLEGIYNMSIYVEDGTGYATDDMLNRVHKAIEGDGTKENPGHLCPGINIRVLTPTITPIDVSCDIAIKSTDTDAAQKELTTSIIDYISSLTIGQSFLLAELVHKLMGIPYVNDVKIKAPTTNYDIDVGSIFKAGTIDITLC